MGKELKEFQLCDSRRLRKKPQDAQDTELFDCLMPIFGLERYRIWTSKAVLPSSATLKDTTIKQPKHKHQPQIQRQEGEDAGEGSAGKKGKSNTSQEGRQMKLPEGGTSENNWTRTAQGRNRGGGKEEKGGGQTPGKQATQTNQTKPKDSTKSSARQRSKGAHRTQRPAKPKSHQENKETAKQQPQTNRTHQTKTRGGGQGETIHRQRQKSLNEAQRAVTHRGVKTEPNAED